MPEAPGPEQARRGGNVARSAQGTAPPRRPSGQGAQRRKFRHLPDPGIGCSPGRIQALTTSATRTEGRPPCDGPSDRSASRGGKRRGFAEAFQLSVNGCPTGRAGPGHSLFRRRTMDCSSFPTAIEAGKSRAASAGRLPAACLRRPALAPSPRRKKARKRRQLALCAAMNTPVNALLAMRHGEAVLRFVAAARGKTA